MARRLPTEMSTSRYKDERNTFVMESLEQAERMMRNFASKYHVDVNDLYQASAERGLRYYQNALSSENPRAYMHKIIRHACMAYLSLAGPANRRKLSNYYQIVSLNEGPIDSEETLEEVMVAIDYVSIKYPQEVYDAVKSLPEKYYVPLCMRYGLFEYPSHTWDEIALILSVSNITVRRCVTKAVELLRERLSEEVLRG